MVILMCSRAIGLQKVEKIRRIERDNFLLINSLHYLKIYYLHWFVTITYLWTNDCTFYIKNRQS